MKASTNTITLLIAGYVLLFFTQTEIVGILLLASSVLCVAEPKENDSSMQI